MKLPDIARPVIFTTLISSLTTLGVAYLQFRPAREEADPNPQQAQEVVRIAGRIAIEGEDGAPLNAELFLTRPGDERFTSTDDDGDFVFTDVPPGTYWILVRNRDGDRSSQKVLIEAHGQRSRTEIPNTWIEYSVMQ